MKLPAYHIYDNIFDSIDSQEKAYWLGFLYADGYNCPDKKYFSIKISIKDKEHLIKFCDFFSINHDSIKEKKPKIFTCMGRQIHDNGSCGITLCGEHITKRLYNLGMVKAKSLILKFPESGKIDDFLLPHFIRGFFDGNGCLTKSISNHATRYRIIITSTFDFCNGLLNKVKNFVPIKIWNKPNDEKVHNCCISGNKQVEIFLNWIYKDASTFLNRKHEQYIEFIKNQESIKKRKNTHSSSFNNISFDKSRNKWVAAVRHNKKTINIGRFITEEAAVLAQKEWLSRCKL